MRPLLLLLPEEKEFFSFRYFNGKKTNELRFIKLTAAIDLAMATFVLALTSFATATCAMIWGALATAIFALIKPSFGAASDWWTYTAPRIYTKNAKEMTNHCMFFGVLLVDTEPFYRMSSFMIFFFVKLYWKVKCW